MRGRYQWRLIGEPFVCRQASFAAFDRFIRTDRRKNARPNSMVALAARWSNKTHARDKSKPLSKRGYDIQVAI